MAWHNIGQAQKLAQKARSTLYRDMNAGRLSYRTESDGRRSIETSELIRVYGEIRQEATVSRDTHGQGDATQVMAELVAEMRALREEVAGLKAELQEVRRLEHKPEPSPITQQVTPRTWWQRFWE